MDELLPVITRILPGTSLFLVQLLRHECALAHTPQIEKSAEELTPGESIFSNYIEPSVVEVVRSVHAANPKRSDGVIK
jgi:hypothetical protein